MFVNNYQIEGINRFFFSIYIYESEVMSIWSVQYLTVQLTEFREELWYLTPNRIFDQQIYLLLLEHIYISL